MDLHDNEVLGDDKAELIGEFVSPPTFSPYTSTRFSRLSEICKKNIYVHKNRCQGVTIFLYINNGIMCLLYYTQINRNLAWKHTTSEPLF